MKKLLKIVGGILLGIVAIIVIVPMAFSGQLEKIAKEEIGNFTQNKIDVDWDDFSLSIFSSFPDLRASLGSLLVKTKGNFETDTLLYVKKFKADIDVWQAIDGKIKVNELILDNPIARGIIGKDSIPNWDVVAADTAAVEEPIDTTSAPLDLNLKRIRIHDADLAYIDHTAPMAAHIKDLDLELSGNFKKEIADLALALDINSVSFWMDNTTLLKNASVDFDAKLEADMGNNKYTFKENTLNFAGIPLAFDGYVQLLDSTAIETDIKLQALGTQFSTVWALIPESIVKSVEGLQTKGAFELYAIAKGVYRDMEHLPAVDAALKITNASVKYPDLPKTLNNINVDVTVHNPSGDADLTTVDVNKFHFELGENPFDAALKLVKPMSNPTFNATLDGKIDLNSLKEAIPLDSMSITGLVNANLNVASDMKSIEDQNYEKIIAKGTVELNQFHFEGSALPNGVDVEKAKLAFSPEQLVLDPLAVKLGKSDFSLNGYVQDYLPYVLKDGTIKGKFTLKSNLIDANELMAMTGPDTTATTATIDTTASVILVPKNINFNFNAEVGTVYYDKLTIKNVRGGVAVKDGIADLNNLFMDMCDGSIGLNGRYNTAKESHPFIDMKIDMNEVDINKLTNSFSTIDSLLPIAKKAHGKVTIGLDIVSDIDETMSPVIKSINGKGVMASESLGIKESDIQTKLSKLLYDDKWKDFTLKDFSLKFDIKDGNIVVDPFKLKMFGKQAVFSGQQGLDQTMAYLLQIPTARKDIANILKKTGLGSAASWAEGEDIPLGIAIKGMLTSPDVAVDLDAAKKAILGEAKAKLEEKGQEVVDKAVDALKDKLKDNEQAQKATDKLKGLLGGLKKKK